MTTAVTDLSIQNFVPDVFAYCSENFLMISKFFAVGPSALTRKLTLACFWTATLLLTLLEDWILNEVDDPLSVWVRKNDDCVTLVIENILITEYLLSTVFLYYLCIYISIIIDSRAFIIYLFLMEITREGEILEVKKFAENSVYK